MTEEQHYAPPAAVEAVERSLDARDLSALSSQLRMLWPRQIVDLLERLGERERATVYRLLPKQEALEVFEALDASLQSDLLHGLQAEDVAVLFAELDPDDRVALMDEMPAVVAKRLMRGLPPSERALTSEVLGYPQYSVGRSMSPEVLSSHPDSSVESALRYIRSEAKEAETIYTVPVLDNERRVVGVVGLRDLMSAENETPVGELMRDPVTARATEDAEAAARRCADLGLLALPVVDSENRLVGILTIDDAVRILEREESEDAARQGGVEPLRRPYLSTPVMSLVRSRIVWLFVLAIGATLTVQVLAIFEDTLATMTILSLFVPLLIGTGGNTGNQAATTVTRALALGDVRPNDALRVLTRELRVGFSLGLVLGLLAFVIAGFVFDFQVGMVLGLSLLAVCTAAATVGGLMPMIARSLKVDPAVFSNPFISTFVDAAGLVIYFLIARSILGI